MTYGIREFSTLMEKAYDAYGKIGSTPFPMDPYSREAVTLRKSKREAYQYVLEMMPDVKQIEQDEIDAARYRRLRAWMSSNVKEGWDEVSNLGSIGSYLTTEDFDGYLDGLGECKVGLQA